MKDSPRLGVNIDHVATLRQARGEFYPSVVEAASVCLLAGADQITIHLREDRRHIQDTDVGAVALVTKKYGKPLNFEMGCHNEIVDIALATGPDWVCLVPEKREERTTEGGLDLLDETNFDKVSQACTKLKAGLPNLKISLFLEASAETLERAAKLPIDAVEIHTGEYAKAFLHGESTESYLGAFRRAQILLKEAGIGCHAGHGLTQESIQPLLQEGLFAEYNVGHWIICQAVFDGLGKVVTTMKESCLQYPLA
ncbi:MAG: pyridoxine 5'-phosphate synthase [Halobacteriovorax sp.]|nr:pyridoxine 5'-phosphate synthase [Halobacteriovorax sp.]